MRRFRKYTFIVFTVLAVSSLSVTPAMAVGQSLEDIVKSQNYSVSTVEKGETGESGGEDSRTTVSSAEESYDNITDSIFKDNATRQSSNDMRDHLSKVADMSGQSKAAEAATAPIAKIVNIIVQFLSYIAILGLGFRVVIDSVYIILPFLRNKLDGGAGGGSTRGSSGGSMPGMGGSFGGGLSGMGGGFGGGGFGGARPQPSSGSSSGSGHQWVSNAAINAVRNEGTPDANGHSRPAYRAYFSDMIYIFILTPIMIILARSGALTTLGLSIGSLISGMISNISGML